MLEPGEAYFCGNYRKCNNAEGCDECKEFEQYMNNQELNKYILIRYDNWINQPIVEGYFATVKEAKAYAEKNCLTDAVSIYKLAKDCKDLAKQGVAMQKGITLKELEKWKERIIKSIDLNLQRADGSNGEILKTFYVENAKVCKNHLDLINRLIEQAKGG